MGGQHSVEKGLGDKFPEGEKFFGLDNFGNTCYCNSVLQALYFCVPLRKQLVRYHENVGRLGHDKNSILPQLAALFHDISNHSKRCGVIAPKNFIKKLKSTNELFNSDMQQDAQELLNYLLNEVADVLQKRQKAAGGKRVEGQHAAKTWIHEIFQGVLANETRCLECETITQRDENFLDLSLEVEANTSVSGCIRKFCKVETLAHSDKFFCDTCNSLQEAQKRIQVKQLPYCLALHLKRFKYNEQIGRFTKLSFRVVFPLELRIPLSKENDDDEDFYRLYAVIVHVGSDPSHGHYVCYVQSHGHWLLFDDDVVEVVDEEALQHVFGSTKKNTGVTDTGYILFYQRAESHRGGMPRRL